MLLTGEYIDINGTTVSVEITTGGTRTPVVKVNDGISGVYFTATEAVTIQGETNDVFDPCLRQSAMVKILTPQFFPDLFLPDVTKSDVVIRRGGITVFRGRVLPQTYSQPFVNSIDSLDINLIDHLSALEYLPWRRAMGPDTGAMSLSTLLWEILGHACSDMDPVFPVNDIYTIPGSPSRSLLTARVNTSIFMDEDDEESDTTLLEVLEGILRYLGLHVVQDGDRFVLFRREKQAAAVPGAIEISNAFGTDTQIEIGEMFNKISVEVDCEEKEELVEAPLDSDLLTSPYPNSTHYCDEYCMLYDKGYWNWFRNLILGKPYPETSGEGIWKRAWYLRTMEHKGWRFYFRQNTLWDGSHDGHGQQFPEYATTGIATDDGKQQYIGDLLQPNQGAALLRIGTARTDYKPDEWNPPATLTEEDCMVIGIDGDMTEVTYDYGTSESPEAAAFRNKQRMAMPRAIYRGERKVSLSPDDEDTTRYIVITGEMALAPVINLPRSFTEVKEKAENTAAGNSSDLLPYVTRTGMGDANKYRAYTADYMSGTKSGLTMFNEQESAEFIKLDSRYLSRSGNWWLLGKYKQADMIPKLGILVCMMIVGDKCLVEKNESGEVSALVWEDYKPPEECESIDEYISQSFTIGIDPKLNDPLVGQWYDIANNVHYSMGIGEEGMAIPVKKSDNVSGKVTFIILGPTDLVHVADNTVHALGGGRYGYLKPTDYDFRGLHVMRLVSSIWIKDLEIKILSDNGGVDPTEEGTLVYMSDTGEDFTNPRDAETFVIGSGLTKEERTALGLRDMVRDNTVMDPDGGGVVSVYDPVSGETAKPEQLYVDRFYRECSRPAIELTQSIREGKMTASMFRAYTHPALSGHEFLPLSIDRDLSEATARMRLRERLKEQ